MLVETAESEDEVVLNDFQRLWRLAGTDILAAVERVGRSGWYVLGREVDQLETLLGPWFGQSHGVGCASGLDALEIALRCAGLSPGDRVVTTPLSAFATTLAVLRIGAVPVFVDVDETGALDLDRVRPLLERADAPRFLLPVHLYGHCLDLDRLVALREDFELTIVEDCAQAIGAGDGENSPAGSVGQAAALSFYPTKNLGALGDGGMLLTSNDDLAARARCLRDYGQTGKFEHAEVGLNSRLDEVQAAILRTALLPRLHEWNARRREIAGRYRDGFRHQGVQPVCPVQAEHSVYHLFPVTVEEPSPFRTFLESRGIHTAVHYPVLIPDQPAMRDVPHEIVGQLDRARQLTRTLVSLPVHPLLTDEEIERVIAAVNAWTGGPRE